VAGNIDRNHIKPLKLKQGSVCIGDQEWFYGGGIGCSLIVSLYLILQLQGSGEGSGITRLSWCVCMERNLDFSHKKLEMLLPLCTKSIRLYFFPEKPVTAGWQI
jgi:hypothetical protein